jgi:hypothetical protein
VSLFFRCPSLCELVASCGSVGLRLLERDARRYAYRLTHKGSRAALLFVLFHRRVCGPLAHSLFQRHTTQTTTPLSKIEAAYRKADTLPTKSSNCWRLDALQI